MQPKQMTFEEHYAAIAPKLTNWLVANGCGHASACDVVQETFLRVWKMHRDLLDDPAQVSGLVWTIARNCRNDLLRQQKREVLQAEIKDGDAGDMQPGTEAGSDRTYLRRRIVAALARLPPLLREAYTLYQIGDLSVREISLRTGVTETLVKVRIFRAKEKLKPLLQDLIASDAGKIVKRL